jgi:hypothetical protein
MEWDGWDGMEEGVGMEVTGKKKPRCGNTGTLVFGSD